MDEFVKDWTMGPGNSAKRLAGEDPMPDKTDVATKDSWKISPMPDKCTKIPMNFELSKKDMLIVKRGHIPEEMEDHWFMYCDDNTIRYHRSWTGFCTYIAKYEKIDEEKYLITELTINRDPEQYTSTDDESDKDIFLRLLVSEYSGW